VSQTAAAIDERRVHGPGGTPALLCVPKVPGRYACAMVLHEKYGLVPHTENLARKLAADGFVVLAPDLFYEYPDQEALHRGEVWVDLTDENVLRGCEDVFRCLRDVPAADPDHLGIVGICQSGRFPLVWASKHPLDAAIIFYGGITGHAWETTEKQPSVATLLDSMVVKHNDHVLGIFGERDHLIAVDDVLRFRNELEQRNMSYQISLYADMPHGWLNDTMPGRYRPAEAQVAWDEAVTYLCMRTNAGARSKEVAWAFRSVKSADYDFKANRRLE
jgi:carboxymethylenebutenolidase